jgi:hypothetical protein
MQPPFVPGGKVMNLRDHYENRNRVPPAELEPYYGQLVGWNLEGTKIIASGKDDSEVAAAARILGYTTDQIVITYLPYPDEILLGGFYYRTEGSK